MLSTATCNHEKPKAADACILEVIGKNNPEHFFVGCQDAELRKKLQQVPGVPLIFCLRNALQLEQPSDFQRQFAKNSEEERLHMTEMERTMLEKRTKKMLASNTEGSDILSAGNERDSISHELDKRKHLIYRKAPSRDGLRVKDRVQFKRKKAKGPNPLSCKKKKNAYKSKYGSQKETKDSDSGQRSGWRKGKGLPETTT